MRLKHLPRGFSLIEMIVVVTLIAVFLIPVIINSRQVGRIQGLRTSASILADDFQSAKSSARDAREKSTWGVRSTGADSYEIISKNQTTTTVNTKKTLEKGIVFERDFLILFEIGTGETDSLKEVVITNDQGQRYQVTIYSQGGIETNQL